MVIRPSFRRLNFHSCHSLSNTQFQLGFSRSIFIRWPMMLTHFEYIVLDFVWENQVEFETGQATAEIVAPAVEAEHTSHDLPKVRNNSFTCVLSETSATSYLRLIVIHFRALHTLLGQTISESEIKVPAMYTYYEEKSLRPVGSSRQIMIPGVGFDRGHITRG